MREEDRPQTFQRVGRELLGPTGEKIIIVFVVLMQLGICTVFINYVSSNTVAMLPPHSSLHYRECVFA